MNILKNISPLPKPGIVHSTSWKLVEITSLMHVIVMLEEKNYLKRLILSISCYCLIKDPFTNSLSDKQIKRNRNKASSKLLALSRVHINYS